MSFVIIMNCLNAELLTLIIYLLYNTDMSVTNPLCLLCNPEFIALCDCHIIPIFFNSCHIIPEHGTTIFLIFSPPCLIFETTNYVEVILRE